MENLFKTELTASLSTISEDGTPWTSTAPYAIIDDKAYIFISAVAEHHANIINNKNVCMMIIQDTSKSQTPFVLERATFKSVGTKLDVVPENVWNAFTERFEVKMLEQLKKMDFDVFELPLTTGRHVLGFGRAYDLKFENNEWVKHHVTDVGHTTSK
ncbi:MAG: pyridoxamine 5'-phosphate oxidase family protein [Peptostreptococcaceae bacterium]